MTFEQAKYENIITDNFMESYNRVEEQKKLLETLLKFMRISFIKVSRKILKIQNSKTLDK